MQARNIHLLDSHSYRKMTHKGTVFSVPIRDSYRISQCSMLRACGGNGCLVRDEGTGC